MIQKILHRFATFPIFETRSVYIELPNEGCLKDEKVVLVKDSKKAAWLEFKFEEKNEKTFLVQRAIFRPKGLFGRLHWYALFPFHLFIFKKMSNALAGKIS